MNFKDKLEYYQALVEHKLDYYTDALKEQNVVCEAMKYSLMNGGKRIRPVLALAFGEMLGADVNDVLPYACAVEMVHTYSLIHDDLPCMDNDDFRRGKPSCHKQFGEEYALLAGDGLLNLAFETVFGKFDELDPEISFKCGKILSSASGNDGMIGGQCIDLLSEGKKISLDELKKLHSLKTGAMITAPCQIGVCVAGGSSEDMKNAELYGSYIGLQFQIVDDILDKTSTLEKLGKPIGSDSENQKSTYVSLLGIEKAKKQAAQLGEKALEVLESYSESAEFLKQLTIKLGSREK